MCRKDFRVYGVYIVMKEIKCPQCGTVIKIDDSAFAEILGQVKKDEIAREVAARLAEERRLREAEEAARAAKDAEKAARDAARHQEELSGKDKEIERLKQALEGWEEKKSLEIEAEKLKAKEAAAEELRHKTEQISELIAQASKDKEVATERMNALLETHKKEVEMLEKEVEVYKNFKAKRSVKLLGEDLEQHCMALYTKNLAGLPEATFEKDNTAVKDGDETKGTKGDFIFRDRLNGTEYLSIMFEMKNESENSTTRHKNADFFEKLDKDRKKKNCEYAVLVSMLEMDNDLYNDGIVPAVGYEKMYVVRPENFIPLINILMQTSRNAAAAKNELAVARSQSVDVTNFEDALEAFRAGFTKNVTDAKARYDKAIEGIDKMIDGLQGIKDNLRVSAKHLTAASNKTEDLTIRSLTYGNKTMKEKFAEARAKKAAGEAAIAPEEQ